MLQDLREQGFLVAEKDYTVALAKCDRCGTVVEPRLSMQWFIKIEPLAKRAIEVVEKGHIRFTPENYTQIYLNWMHNIHDWCISRQLWWGHRIPAWSCLECSETIVARTAPQKCTKCSGSNLEQAADVLDTWFSSGLLPFTALGWPEATPDLAAFYPTSLLITGFDILFFWVARMIMLGCWFMSPPHRPSFGGAEQPSPDDALRDSVPFREVYIHALVLDADRQKMSKTKGNVLDPIEVIEKYGTDATRFTLASMSSPGTDIAFNPSRTEGYRAFANKIWNAARFMFMNVDRVGSRGAGAPSTTLRAGLARDSSKMHAGISGFSLAKLEDRWILSRFNRVAGEVDEALKVYRFDDAARAIYDFFWGELCDWYIELIKPRLLSEDEEHREAVRAVCGNLVALFEASLRLLHPIMPFITEEIWYAIYDENPPLRSISLATYPQASGGQLDASAENDVAILQELIVTVRNLRAEMKVEQKQRVPIQVYSEKSNVRSLIEQNHGAIERLASVETITLAPGPLSNVSGARSTPLFDVHVVYEEKIDIPAERERWKKELEKIEKEIANGQRQLQNEQFLAKAPTQVVEGIRRRAEELEVLRTKAQTALAKLT